jgi:hypothetical protein
MGAQQLLGLTLAVLSLASSNGVWGQAVGSAATDGVVCSTLWVVDACLACWPSLNVCRPCTCRAAFIVRPQCSPRCLQLPRCWS